MRRVTALILGCSGLLAAGTTYADQQLEAFADSLLGTFDSGSNIAQPALEDDSDRLFASYTRVHAPELGELVVYQQLNQHEDLSLYRQRLLVFSLAADGTIVQTALRLVSPESWAFTPYTDVPQRTATPKDVEPFMAAGCEQKWTRQGDAYSGYVDPHHCVVISSRTGKPRGIEAEALLSQSSLSLTERGFDEEGKQVFGSAPNEFMVLQRR